MTFEEIRKYQLAQLELIDVVNNLCSELNLTYYIIGGTLLGAVRHKGFIPWDPDIDIAMPRDDYEKLRQYFAENKSDRYFYQHYSTEKNHLFPHALLIIKGSHVKFKSRTTSYLPAYDGIYLDIFPLDNAPESQKKQAAQMKRIKRIERIIELKAAYRYRDSGILKLLAKSAVKVLLSPISFKYLNEHLDATMRKYNDPSAKTFVSMASHYSYWKQLMSKDIYGAPTKIEYEGMMLSAPEKTHEYLTRIFGDYMQLPPEEQRLAVLEKIERIEYGTKSGVEK